MTRKRIRNLTAVAVALGVIGGLGYLGWPALINAMMPAGSRGGSPSAPRCKVTSLAPAPDQTSVT